LCAGLDKPGTQPAPRTEPVVITARPPWWSSHGPTGTAIGALLSEVQLATGDAFGGMASLANGFHGDVVTRTQAMLAVWREAADSSEKSSHLIERTAGFFTGADLFLLMAAVGLIATVWRRLKKHRASGRRTKAVGRSCGPWRGVNAGGCRSLRWPGPARSRSSAGRCSSAMPCTTRPPTMAATVH
jgi:hypothetical protein